jgi:hypothetical protein
MQFNERVYDIVIVCDLRGIIVRIIKNDIRWAVFPIIGQSIVDSADNRSKSKMIRFLYEVIDMHNALNWEVNLNIKNQLRTISISGEQIDNNCICLGIVSKPEILNYYEEIMAINNEQLNEIRKLSKLKSSLGEEEYKEKIRDLENLLLFDVGARVNCLWKYIKALNNTENSNKNERKGLLHFIDQLCSKIITNIDSTIDVNKLDNFEINIIWDEFSILELFREVLGFSDFLLKEHEIEAEINYLEPKLPIYIHGDKDKMMLVLSNLFLHIIQCSKSNSKLLVDFNRVGENTLIMLNFNPLQESKNFGEDIEYLMAQKVIQSIDGAMWIEDRNDSKTIYIGIREQVH